MSTLIYGEAESKKSLDSNIDNVKNQNPKKKKLVKISEEQDRYYRNSEKYLKEGRFGSEYVGFIGLPDWKEMKWLIDIYSESYTLEISKDGVDIYTLDSFDINDKKGLSDEWLAKTLAEQEFRKYLNEGYKRNSLEIKKRSKFIEDEKKTFLVSRSHLVSSRQGRENPNKNNFLKVKLLNKKRSKSTEDEKRPFWLADLVSS